MAGPTYEVTVSNGVVFNNTGAAATADDATPSIANIETLTTPANTGATEITQLDDAAAYQRITIICTSSTNAPTITDGGNFALSASWAPAAGDTLTLITITGTAWYEISRSTNA